MLYRLNNPPAWRRPADAELIIAGSILEHMPAGWQGTVAGAGFLKADTFVDLSRANILGVRGKLTQKRLKAKNAVLGDPGLLASRFVTSAASKYDLSVVPHWSDADLHARFPQAHLIDPTRHPEEVVTEIARSKRVISSSLHGLVVADAFGIPRQAETFQQAASEGGTTKLLDYSSIYETHPHFGEMWTAPARTVERVQNELWDMLLEALI